jgi:hypothetical protein
MRVTLRIALLAVAFALATAAFGWWTVPLLGGVWGAVASPGTRPALTAGAAACLGWGLLLAWAAAQGPALVLAQRVGGVMGLPGWLFAVLTVAFAALLGGTAAAVVFDLLRRHKLLQ